MTLLVLVAALAATPAPAPSAATAAAPAVAAATPAWTAAQNRLFADSQLVVGDRISVEVVGRGPDLVLIPGLASSRATWRRTAERLRGRYRLHLVQIAGFAGDPARGNASGPVVVPTAQAIADYTEKAGLAPATMIGHSLGGTMILWLAENRPQVLKRALIVDALPWFAPVILGPSATPEQAMQVAQMIRTAPPQPRAAAQKQMAAMVTGQADLAQVTAWSEASDQGVTQRALADDLELDLRPTLASIRTPITLLYPDYAAIGAPAGATDLTYGDAFKPLPGVKLERIDHSLHFIMLDRPDAFAADLDAFLAG